MKTVGLLLAAGASRRFGTANKLLTPYQDKPLIAHTADAMRGCALHALVGVVRHTNVESSLDGFTLVHMAADAPDQADSLRAGVRACLGLDPDRILVALGDMPLVTSGHLQTVMARCSRSIASASTDGKKRMPPACFPISMAKRLMSLQGDSGAASILKDLPPEALVQAPRSMLKDIDVVSDLA